VYSGKDIGVKLHIRQLGKAKADREGRGTFEGERGKCNPNVNATLPSKRKKHDHRSK